MVSLKAPTNLGVVLAALLTQGDQQKLQPRMPQRQNRIIIQSIAPSEEFNLVITDFDNICSLPNAQNLLPSLLW